MDVEKLLNALNNDNNEDIINLDFKTITKNKNDILQQLRLPRKETLLLNKKLKEYRYIADLKELKFGSYIRWIKLNNPESIKLTNGGIICDMLDVNNDVHIRCKNNINMMFQLKLSECIIFQKLTPQEKIILKAIKYLED